MSNEYVLDACSLIAFFNQEEGASEVKSIITKALDSGSRILMHRLNLFEVYYDLSRSSDEDKVNRAMSVINNFPVTIIDEITETLMKEAARFKHKISTVPTRGIAGV